MKRFIQAVAVTVMTGFASPVSAQDKPAAPTYHEEQVADSNPLRTEQAKELDAYVNALKSDATRLRTVFKPDYASPQAFEQSAETCRQAFANSIGHPPPGVAMVGLSYGGYYALVTPALDTRIKVSVSSCYYGVQEGRYERDELSVPSDFMFKDRFTLFRDSDIVSLICPRALEIQAGSTDGIDHREPGKALAPISKSYYEKLGLPDRFRHLVFEGRHEFHDESAWEFVKKHL